MLILSTLWWLLFWTATGLCVGSFLNVVIYRLPRDQSLRGPLWSACPHCGHRIRWYDNLPLISIIVLGGRCRDCRWAIATRYPVVEASMAIVVLVLLDAFFIGHVRSGLCERTFGLADQLAVDWPIFIAHLVLFACLFAMSAIDLEHYWVDVRFTNFATLTGFVLHTLWTPRHETSWLRPFDTTAVVALLALAGLGIVWILLICQPHVDPEDFGEPASDDHLMMHTAEANKPVEVTSRLDPPRMVAWLTGLVLVGLVVWLFCVNVELAPGGHWLRALLPLLLFFFLIVGESAVERQSDHDIIEAIHEERRESRKMVAWEALLLVPAVLFGLAGYYAMTGDGDLPATISEALHTKTRLWEMSLFRNWEPLYGLATAATGYMIAGGLGWAVRIIFTLVLGKEAFGAGDIHLMAAAGCVAGWPAAVIAFFLTCGLALLGWLITLRFKRTRALPLGPWFSLSLLAVVVFLDPILALPLVQHTLRSVRMLFF